MSERLFSNLSGRQQIKSLLKKTNKKTKKRIFIWEKWGWFPAYQSACSGAPSLEMNTYCGTAPPIMTYISGVIRKGLVALGRFCVRLAIVMVDLCEPLHVMNKYTAMQRSICRSREHRPRWWDRQIVFPWRHYSAHANVTKSVLLLPWNRALIALSEPSPRAE